MARISEVKGNIPEKYEKEMRECFFCDDNIEQGGMWAGKYHIGICNKCAYNLVDLMVDTIDDTTSMDSEEKEKYINNIVKERIAKKELIAKKNKEISPFKKFDLKYYAEIGIVDWFGLTLSEHDIINRLNKDSIVDGLYLTKRITQEDLEDLIREIKQLIFNNTGEYPMVVRFFGNPTFHENSFSLNCIAKISNNGSTYLFSDGKDIFKYVDRYQGYEPTIKTL